MSKMKLVLAFVAGIVVGSLGYVGTAWATQGTPAPMQEVLVLASGSTAMPVRDPSSIGFEIQNLGPNPIYCQVAGTAVVNKSRKVSAGNAWSASVKYPRQVNCIAGTADQVTGAATIFTETY